MRKLLLIAFLVVFAVPVMAVDVNAQTVAYNTQTGKYHKQSCRWAKKCTRNCIYIDKKEAVKNGGVPCKVCGG
ncbi:MAG: hypothetical protein LBL47_04915 [Lactobacillus sp.]|jgi:methylphosphotriester-DNA--protein-cysteine methyltransferase|nr:hypothetical protein [Lactobacillus sp.]